VTDQSADLRSLLAAFFPKDSCAALQDSWPPQVVALVGIIGWLRGHALQDIIAADLNEIMVRGNAILHPSPASTSQRKTRSARAPS
jgi:hypothetical protein